MVSIPSVQYNQQWAKIAIETTPGQMQIHQPPSELKVETTPLKLEITNALQSPPGHLSIDQSRAREALGIGSTFWFVGRVANEASRIAMEAIGEMVERGNQAGDLAHSQGNVFAEFAAHSFFSENVVNYDGPYEVHNVDLDFQAQAPEIQFTGARADLSYNWSPTEFQYDPAKVQIYLAQKPVFELIPPQIDLKV
ncbi:DUF6470 family protein [Paenibacillus sp. LjRoot56]|uniref:DUF6470 family protein n=1 Tax=Paenibacillus sp. LjRoot56 TaxID=3342333 RepID=UPI003ECE420B